MNRKAATPNLALVGFAISAMTFGLSIHGLFGAPANYRIDPAHSSVGFSVRHLMISNVRGEFTDFSAQISYDSESLQLSRVDATVKAASIDTQNEKRDAHLQSPDFFDVAKHPEIRFVSREIRKAGTGLQVLGDLTMHGETRPVTLEIEGPTAPVTDPWGNERIGVVARTVINRKDFGLNWNQALESGGVVVGEEVSITLDLSLVREK